MKPWNGPASLTILTVCALLLSAPACVGQETQADSLVWYVEALEADLALCRVDGRARADSLTIRLEFATKRLEWAEADAAKWYTSPPLMFMLGAALGLVVAGAALNVTR